MIFLLLHGEKHVLNDVLLRKTAFEAVEEVLVKCHCRECYGLLGKANTLRQFLTHDKKLQDSRHAAQKIRIFEEGKKCSSVVKINLF